MVGSGTMGVPVMRPRLPDAEAILPYLRQIDAARWYSNDGPLVQRLSSRFAAHFSVAEDEVALVANGTVGLTLGLRATGAVAGGRCLVPAWSFSATAHAILGAGLVPYFLDVEPTSWSLTPQIARQALADGVSEVAAVMPVMPFGRPLDLAAWDAFSDETGIPVVVDAAAGFDSLVPAHGPTVLSLHATKAFGVGEGGVVICRDANYVGDVRRLANFGFTADRQSAVPATNAKMSEYTGAVGLARLDTWPIVRDASRALTKRYIDAAADLASIQFMPGYGNWATSTCVAMFGERGADAAAQNLAQGGIESRRWWGDGCHRQPAFADCQSGPLPVTEMLSAVALGLPFFPELDDATINRVLETATGAGEG